MSYARVHLLRDCKMYHKKSFGAPAVTFSYTPSGKRASMADAAGTTTYIYDGGDRCSRGRLPKGQSATPMMR